MEGVSPDPEITIERGFRFRSKGREQRLIVTSATADRRTDPTLIKAIARAQRWFDRLKSRQVDSIADLGPRENAPCAWISNQLSLAFLAPDIVETIIEGEQPPNLTLDRLVEIAGASSDWSLQRQAVTAGH